MSFAVIEIPKRFICWLQIGLAARRLKRLSKEEREQAKQALANQLANARGLTMKIGQIMATGEEKDVFKPLITSIQPLALAKVQNQLKQYYQQPLETLFKEFKESQAAASLGQVHYAQLIDGREVAVKVLYPAIEDTLKAELKLSHWMPSAGAFKRWQFDAKDYKTTLERQLLREIDYKIEAQTQQRFKESLNVRGLHIPDIIPELSYRKVLTQSWETGERFEKVCQWGKKQRLEIARTLLETLFKSLFVLGEVHADPHNGNYLFRLDKDNKPVTVLLDYGCTVWISRDRRLALLKLIDAYQNKQTINPLQCLVAIGFKQDKLIHINQKLPKLCEVLLLPFIEPRAFNVDNWQLANRLQTILAEERWWFRAAGSADLMLLLRAFHGLITQLSQLKVALPWGGLLKYCVGEKLLAEARALNLPDVNVKAICSRSVEITARKLCVNIYEGAKLVLSLELPAEAALELEDVIPENAKTEINHHCGINLAKLTQELQQGVHPQTLFKTNIQSKNYHVWLE